MALVQINDRLALFEFHDAKVRRLEKEAIECWSEMARSCMAIEENELWKDGGFESFNGWLVDAAPQSRSAMYMAMGLVKELADVPAKDLKEIPIGSAKVLAKVPKRLRKKAETLKAAKKRPREFVNFIQTNHADLHIESLAPRQYGFTQSQAVVVDGAIELAKAMFDLASDEAAWEAVAEEFLQSHQEVYNKLKDGSLI